MELKEHIIKAIIELRVHGLDNGGTIGYHAEWCDDVADRLVNAISLIKELTEENEKLLTALANYDRQTEVRIAEEYYTAEAYEELREENERLRAELEKRPPKLIITKLPKAEGV